MKILFFNQFYLPDPAPTGRLLADVARALVERGHEATVLCSRRAYRDADRHYAARETIDGVRVLRVPGLDYGQGRVARQLASQAACYFATAWRAIRLERPDVCVALTTPPFVGTLGAMLRAVKRSRLVLWTMDLYPEAVVSLGHIREGGAPHRALAAVSRGLYRRASAIVSLGEVMTERLVAAGAPNDKIVTAHNWVPAETISPIPHEQSKTRRQWGLEPEDVSVVYSGALGRGHDLETFVHAAARLSDIPRLRVIFAGRGRGREPLEKLVSDLRLQNVSIHQPQPLDAVADALAAADIHLVSQRPGTEGILVPSKIYGVLAAGRPTIFVGPDHSEAAHLVSASDSGIAAAPGDVVAVADAIAALARDRDLRLTMGQRAWEHYENHLGMSKSVPRIVSTIEQAAASRKRPDGPTAHSTTPASSRKST
jgi:colanic acid biosynthesis glycosyl transferase WcaI